MPRKKDLITAQALADALNLSVETIWRYTRERKIPFVELGSRQYRYIYHDVVAALAGASVREKGYRTVTYTYKDYLELPKEPGHRFEVLEGELVKDPMPDVTHQRVVRRLQRLLEDYFWQADAEGEVFNAPLDVTLAADTVVQPDIFYIAGTQKEIVKERRIDGPPTLLVEVLSPATSRKDRLRKLKIYQQAGVKHFWLVNPVDMSLECFALHNNLYSLVASGLNDDVVEHPDFDNLAIDLEKLWDR